MRRAVLGLALLASVGCVSFPWSEPRPQDPGAVVGPRRQPPAPVLADQVTSENAHALSQALWDELDFMVRTPLCPEGCPHCQGKEKR